MKQLFIVFLLLTIGCAEQNSTPESDGGHEHVAASQDEVQFVVRWYPDGEDSLKNERSTNPSPQEISTAFDSIDWSKADSWTGIELIASNPHPMMLKVEGTESQQVEMEFSEQPGPGTKWIHKFAPLVPVDVAQKAMIAFANNDESFQSMVSWESN